MSELKKDGDLSGSAGLGGTPNQNFESQVLTELPLAKKAVLSIASLGKGELEFRFPQNRGPQTKVKIVATDVIHLFGDKTPYNIVGVGYDQTVFVLKQGEGLDKTDGRPVDWSTICELNPFIKLDVGQTVHLMGESASFRVMKLTSPKTMIIEKVHEEPDAENKEFDPDVRHVAWHQVQGLNLRFGRTWLIFLCIGVMLLHHLFLL